jgi:hypothetical protein
VDSFCCQIQWDSACVELANSPQFQGQCGCEGGGCGDPRTGSCFVVHDDDPFCSDAGCCSLVCAFDPSCCDIGWSQECVDIAIFFCGGGFETLMQVFQEGVDAGVREAVPPRVPPEGWIPPRLRAMPPVRVPVPKGFPQPQVRPDKQLAAPVAPSKK